MLTQLTARSLITECARASGSTGYREELSSEEAVQILRLLNELIDEMRLHKLWPVSIKTINETLTPGKSTYTIGITSAEESGPPDFEYTRPVWINSIKILSGGAYIPLTQISDRDWESMVISNVDSGMPCRFRYTPSWQYGVIEFNSGSTQSYDIKISANVDIAEYALDDEMQLAPGYYDFFRKKLTAKWYLYTEQRLNPSLELEAEKSLKRIKSNNSQGKEMSTKRVGRMYYDYKTNTNRMSGG